MKIIKYILIPTILLLLSSCTKVIDELENGHPCSEDGSCKFRPDMNAIIEELMCIDNGINTTCTSYYQNTFIYTVTESKGENYSDYGFNSYGKNKEGESITSYHSVCNQLIESGNPNTYLTIPTCHLEYGSHTSMALRIGSYNNNEAAVKETLTYYDKYNEPTQSISNYVPIAKFLVGLDNHAFYQNWYGISLDYIEIDQSNILSGYAECKSKRINPPTMPVNECRFTY